MTITHPGKGHDSKCLVVSSLDLFVMTVSSQARTRGRGPFLPLMFCHDRFFPVPEGVPHHHYCYVSLLLYPYREARRHVCVCLLSSLPEGHVRWHFLFDRYLYFTRYLVHLIKRSD